MLRGISTYCGVCQYIVWCVYILWGVSIYCVVCPHIVGCVYILWGVSTYCGVCPHIVGCVHILWGVSTYCGVCIYRIWTRAGTLFHCVTYMNIITSEAPGNPLTTVESALTPNS